MNSPDNHPFHWHYAELDDKNFQIHGQSLLLLLILFSILLLFTLICLYTRWACRYRQSTAAAAQQQQQQGLQMVRPVGLDRATIESLPVYLHRSSASEAQCSICLSSFQEEEKVKVLPECNHAFHPECVDMWLKTHSSCPLCRASLGGPAEAACVAA
ncbi:RING-H2 finger protein ATL66-like [Magnolia sinica]|uniref:RING-H2 finger protein ATL66-like n=1 Tax=Magnolia sinica TaxID=86752 RepID=UPI00265A575E|nr:RING-H2 finger protein ATL66-like [Magnolia sinica]